MGYEWSLKLNNKTLSETLPFIRKCLIEEGFEKINSDSEGISIPSSNDKWSSMDFTLQDDYLYCVFYGGSKVGEEIMCRIRQTLEEHGFDVVVEEL